MYLYSVKLDVHRNTARYLAALLRAERRRRATRKGTRALSPFKQALFVLAWLRDKPDIERLGAGFALSRSTAYRSLDEGIRVLAAKAPTLTDALQRARTERVPLTLPIISSVLVRAGRWLSSMVWVWRIAERYR